MSEEDISRLAGETQQSSIERQRLDGKRETLEKGLKGLKNLVKRRNMDKLPKQDQLVSKVSEQTLPLTTSPSEVASIATGVEETTPGSVVSDEPSPDKVVVSPSVDDGHPRAEVSTELEDFWAVRRAKKDKRKLLAAGYPE